MRQKILILMLAGVLLGLGFSAASAQNVLFIVDFSGSMNEKVGDRPKIVIAKEVFRNTVMEMPASAKLGLMLYGHRRAKDCHDIELVSDIGQQPPASMADYVDRLRARGETPIATALLQSLSVFAKHKGEQNSVVLITDGREECQGDPCAAAQALAAAGLDVKVNVVGFRLSAEERNAVECISKNSGGHYFDAQNAGALKSALAEVRNIVAQAPPPPPPPQASGPPKRPNLLAQSQGGELIAAPQQLWQALNDEKEDPRSWFRTDEEGLYGFKDGRPAKFDTFTMYIPGSDEANVKEFELLAGDSPGGNFRSIGRFTTQNIRIMKSPYQEFKFDAVTAKYLKVKLLSNYKGDSYIRAYEFKLFGELVSADTASSQANPAQGQPRTNLLSAREGGELLTAPQQLWQTLNDGKEEPQSWFHADEEGVYGFKDGQAATFDTFTMYVAGADEANVKEFELFAGDPPGDNFRSIGKFTTQNIRMMKSPYQEFKFAPVTAKYLKVKLLSNYKGDGYIRAYEFQLLGDVAAVGGSMSNVARVAEKSKPNLLASAQGGELLAAPQQLWQTLTDGKEEPQTWFRSGEEGVYGFKDGRSATFDTFTIYIAGSDEANVKEFELLAGDSPSENFRSIGTFSTQNIRMMKSPYQEFKFDPVTAKYFKVKFLSNYKGDGYIRAYEFRLHGDLK